MCKRVKDDERFCVICNKSLNNERNIRMIVEDSKICSNCHDQFVRLNRVYKLDIDWIVLYEYNEFLERLLFRYKEQKDILLAGIFFDEYISKIKELSKKYAICVMCSSDKNRMERGFEPIIKMLEAHNIEVYSPLYKTIHVKQSSKNKEERENIKKYIHRKELYFLPSKPILLIDDVLTTGNTIQRGIELLNPDKILILCANPLWIKRMKVEKQKRF